MRVLASVALLAALAGCGTDGLAFREDTRLDIVEPADRARVALPVTLRWETDGLRLGDPDGPQAFAVFVDREPVRPGRSLRDVGDDECKKTPGCPDPTYLRERHVHVTTETSLVLEAVPDLRSSTRTGASDRHEAVIVLLDAEGRRMGEAAYAAEFTVEREG